jgi:hypothetical protein
MTCVFWPSGAMLASPETSLSPTGFMSIRSIPISAAGSAATVSLAAVVSSVSSTPLSGQAARASVIAATPHSRTNLIFPSLW